MPPALTAATGAALTTVQVAQFGRDLQQLLARYRLLLRFNPRRAKRQSNSWSEATNMLVSAIGQRIVKFPRQWPYIVTGAMASVAAFGLSAGRADAVTTLVTFPFNNSNDGNSGLNYSAIDASVLSAASVGGGTGFSTFGVSPIVSPGMEVLKTSPGSAVVGATAADALSNNWSFTISLTPTGSVNIGSITLDWLRSGTSGSRGWFLRSSLDNYATDLYSVSSPAGTAVAVTPVNIALSGFTGLTSQTDFRFYTYADTTIRRVDFSNISFLAAGTQPPPAGVPAPLPLLGAGAAFTSSRRLRRMSRRMNRCHERGVQG